MTRLWLLAGLLCCTVVLTGSMCGINYGPPRPRTVEMDARALSDWVTAFDELWIAHYTTAAMRCVKVDPAKHPRVATECESLGAVKAEWGKTKRLIYGIIASTPDKTAIDPASIAALVDGVERIAALAAKLGLLAL